MLTEFYLLSNKYTRLLVLSGKRIDGTDRRSVLAVFKWERFEGVIERAKDACLNAGIDVADHFPSTGKMVRLGSGSKREINDFMLTRYACYLYFF